MTTNLSYIVYPNAELGEAVRIGEFSVVGRPARPSSPPLPSPLANPKAATVVGEQTYIGTHVLIEQGVRIGHSCVIESYCVLEANATIGRNCFIVHGARVCGDSTVGDNCVVGGFVAERSQVGSHCRMLGRLLHRHLDPTTLWDAYVEPAPILEDNVFVALTATIIGNVRISHHVYITAGSIVTRSVPSYHVVHGTNRICPVSDWPGPLRDSPFWR